MINVILTFLQGSHFFLGVQVTLTVRKSVFLLLHQMVHIMTQNMESREYY